MDGAKNMAELAIEVFGISVKRAIGGMAAVHGVDALVFTGGIGEHDYATREAVGDFLPRGQPVIDPGLNGSKERTLRRISVEGASVAVYVVPAQEDLMIARHVARMVRST